jgi:hypothetical protein
MRSSRLPIRQQQVCLHCIAISRTHTGLLLLKSQLVPVGLHAVPQLHPQFGLFLRRQSLPALLDAGEDGIGDGMFGRGAGLLRGQVLALELRTGIETSHWRCRGPDSRCRAASDCSGDGAKEHCARRERRPKRAIESRHAVAKLSTVVLKNGTVCGEWSKARRRE